MNPIALAKYVDHSKIYKETLDKTKPRTVYYDRYAGKGPGGNIIYETIKQSSIDPTELYNKFSTDLENDDGFRNYINQTAQLQGRDPSELMQNLLSDYARQRKWFGNSGPEKYQGAGWAKAASARWEEFLKHHGITYRMMKPGRTWKGTNAGAMFARLTGWKGRTSNHARDAAWMVFQMAAGKAKMIVR